MLMHPRGGWMFHCFGRNAAGMHPFIRFLSLRLLLSGLPGAGSLCQPFLRLMKDGVTTWTRSRRVNAQSQTSSWNRTSSLVVKCACKFALHSLFEVVIKAQRSITVELERATSQSVVSQLIACLSLLYCLRGIYIVLVRDKLFI